MILEVAFVAVILATMPLPKVYELKATIAAWPDGDRYQLTIAKKIHSIIQIFL